MAQVFSFMILYNVGSNLGCCLETTFFFRISFSIYPSVFSSKLEGVIFGIRKIQVVFNIKNLVYVFYNQSTTYLILLLI